MRKVAILTTFALVLSAASNVDRQALRAVAPGDLVTVTGAGGTTADRFVAQSVQPRR